MIDSIFPSNFILCQILCTMYLYVSLKINTYLKVGSCTTYSYDNSVQVIFFVFFSA